ncbi:2TM domain-containing protein [Flavivirga sp. 57AJ16]|uniref:2TM domain-containing protein n=1 Tax=Flavivirga sp. 57AJ16 TaxID=3025307 RepID=UPI002365D554|nr:2TM domain-containing protein [Flavivirga sp. 57AJ16]MDD7887078.1 2TM domain-containing protein [Flavivirga sp. 57AJ16]
MKKKAYNHRSAEYKREDAYLRAQKRIKEIKGFYRHALCYVLINLFIFIIIAVNAEGYIWHFGTLSTPLFWGIGLGFHALRVFGKNAFFSKKWETRKINEFLDRENKRWE